MNNYSVTVSEIIPSERMVQQFGAMLTANTLLSYINDHPRRWPEEIRKLFSIKTQRKLFWLSERTKITASLHFEYETYVYRIQFNCDLNPREEIIYFCKF